MCPPESVKRVSTPWWRATSTAWLPPWPVSFPENEGEPMGRHAPWLHRWLGQGEPPHPLNYQRVARVGEVVHTCRSMGKCGSGPYVRSFGGRSRVTNLYRSPR